MIPLTRHGAPSGNNLTHSIIIGVALPVAQDTTQLDRGTIVNTSSSSGEVGSVFRMPRSAILDLGAFALAPDREALLSGRTCDPYTSAAFDRAPARLNSGLIISAIARRSLGFTGDGIEILQRTRTSERDFEYASPLRRSLRRQ
jgi:hypothetical protein